MIRPCALALAIGVALSGSARPATAARLLDEGRIEGWQERSFSGSTRYTASIVGGERVLAATARASASSLYVESRIALSERPRLRWRWRIEAPLVHAGERTREGDDFVARVYVIAAGSGMLRTARAICYVWAAHLPAGSDWPNPYSKHVRMVALRSGGAEAGRWVSESRDVAADFARLFEEVPSHVAGVAIMTDTDNTGANASAWFDDLEWVTTGR